MRIFPTILAATTVLALGVARPAQAQHWPPGQGYHPGYQHPGHHPGYQHPGQHHWRPHHWQPYGWQQNWHRPHYSYQPHYSYSYGYQYAQPRPYYYRW